MLLTGDPNLRKVLETEPLKEQSFLNLGLTRNIKNIEFRWSISRKIPPPLSHCGPKKKSPNPVCFIGQ
jgi:hypothetical protein